MLSVPYPEKVQQFSRLYVIINSFLQLLLHICCGHYKCCKQKCESGA